MKFKDPFGTIYMLKSILILAIGLISWFIFTRIQKLRISGISNLRDLPKENVLFVSNHQTYFADATAINHGFHLARNRSGKNVKYPFYLFPPFVTSYYVAARETMKQGGILPYLFTYAGAILVRRTWRAKGEEVNRQVFPEDQKKIIKALGAGWVLTFPQGTTKPFSPPRKGTARIIQISDPIVVPVVVEGFRKGFEKKGLIVKKKGMPISVEFKTPRKYSNLTIEEILRDIMKEIGQLKGFDSASLQG
jgi:1-acyl-sn-glycerol-3-phosphate acyltransferase